MEYISATKISPLISKGVCKVCYVGQDPNRNHTVITREVAEEMGRNLPGSPVVGCFDKDKQDFLGHERELKIEDGAFELVDLTKPYGFVPTDSRVWFQKFSDEGVEHEYLCCEVYIWTGTYPESKRILESGNNHSMELDGENSSGIWANDNKTNGRIFIYNEALVAKLCVLGEDIEPCFEGSQFKKQFSLEDQPEWNEFKQAMTFMLSELQETLNQCKGGSQEPMEEIKNTIVEEVTPEEFTKKEDSEEEKKPQEKKSESEDKDEDDEKKKKYNLDEVIEYTELLDKYNQLQNDYSALQKEKESLDTEVSSLREFKASTDRVNKQAMIDSFYMLSDADKKDVIEHIDTYSVDDIEAKLSIICVRNKVNFNLEQDNKQNEATPQGLFNLNSAVEQDNAPDWVKAIRDTASKMQ